MNTNKNTHKDRTREPESNLNRDINRNSQQERFPEANLSKESRKDSEQASNDLETDEELTQDIAEGKTARGSVDDIAGVADLNDGMRRAEES
jgi:hypothetical protein